MSYINEALKKAQKDRDVRLMDYGSVLKGGMRKKKHKIRTYEYLLFGTILILIVIIAYSLLDRPFKIENEPVKILTGISFDIKGERVQTAFRRIGDREREESYEITVKNNSKKKEDIIVTEKLFGDWEILYSSHTYKKISSTEIEFLLPVSSESSGQITYTVRYKR